MVHIIRNFGEMVVEFHSSKHSILCSSRWSRRAAAPEVVLVGFSSTARPGCSLSPPTARRRSEHKDMNFFDYDLTAGSRTPPQSGGSSEPGAEPTLNEEVTQVVGQLGRLWGGFRKQVR